MLSDTSKQYIEGLHKEVLISINSKTIYVAHYGLKGSQYKNFIEQASQSELDLLFDSTKADVVIYGHDHTPSLVNGNAFYINPGSCGCPGRDRNIARGGILEVTDSVKYNQLLIEYNVDKVTRKIEELDFPAKEEIKKFFYGL